MSIKKVFLFAFLTICVVAVIALNPISKTCKFDTSFSVNGFNFTFETNEKSTPSDQE